MHRAFAAIARDQANASTHTLSRHRVVLRMVALIALTAMLGCKSTPAPTTSAQPTPQTAQYPPRPTTPPPPFRVFHHDATSLTLVTTPDATDAQIEAIIYQLHDAARTHAFDQLHIPQKLVDARDPILWFHIYRGPKCADEKYTNGPLPCGASYHAAGDYTLGSFANKNHDAGVLLEPNGQEIQLWNPTTPPVH